MLLVMPQGTYDQSGQGGRPCLSLWDLCSLPQLLNGHGHTLLIAVSTEE